MSMKLNRDAYEQLIEEDIEAMRLANVSKLEREHIEHVLRHSVVVYYSATRKLKELADELTNAGYLIAPRAIRDIVKLIDGDNSHA